MTLGRPSPGGAPQALELHPPSPPTTPVPARSWHSDPPFRPPSPGMDLATGNAPLPRPRPPFLPPPPPRPGRRPRIPGLAWPPLPTEATRRRPRSSALAAVPSTLGAAGPRRTQKEGARCQKRPCQPPRPPSRGPAKHPRTPKLRTPRREPPTQENSKALPPPTAGSCRGGQITQRQVPPAAQL